jgi:hypothetical protein
MSSANADQGKQNRMKRIALILAAAQIASAQEPPPPSITTKIAIRKLGPTVRTSAVTFGNISGVRRLSDGRLLVNDASRRQVLLLDSTLANPTIVIDSVGGRDNSYGLRTGGIVPYRGDSTFFVDPTSSTMLLINPAGKIARVMSMPTSAVSYLANPGSNGYPGFSETFGIVFRMQSSSFRYPNNPPAEGAPEIVIKYEDSVAIVGMKLSTRKGDTLAKYGTGQQMTARISWNNFDMNGNNEMFPIANDWALAADGSIAMLSGREYRLRWINTDGTKTESPRLPFTWDPNPDDEKQRIADSINVERQKSYENAVASRQRRADSLKAEKKPVPTELTRPMRNPEKVRMLDIPDYFPAYERQSNSMRADLDNNIWIRPRPPRSQHGGTVYDVVDRKGELVDKVELPQGRSLIGFGPGGIVYLTVRDAGSTRIEQARFKP